MGIRAKTSSGGGGGLTFVLKTADETKMNDIVFADDLHLQFESVANTIYIVFWLTHPDAETSPAYKYKFSIPSGATFLRPDGTWFSDGNTIRDETFAKVISGSGNPKSSCIIAWIEIGATAGTVAIQWAQNVSHADPTTMGKGCCLMYKALN